MKILYLTSRFPYPLEKGDKLRAFYQIKELSRYHDIHLLSITDEEPLKKDLEKLFELTKTMHIIRITPAERYISLLHAFFNGLPYQIAWFYSHAINKKIMHITQEIQPDHVFCQLPRMAEYCMDMPYKKTMDYMDCFGVGMKRRAVVASGWASWIYHLEAKRMIRYEETISEKFEHLTIISQQDKDQFTFALAKNIHVITNGVGPGFLHYSGEDPKKYDLVFVGNMGYLPNIESVEYLITQILPLCPSEMTVLIAGANPAYRVKKLMSHRVTVSGWIDDIRHAYASSRIFVAPMWSGTGQQNKILEAMAMGIPCITTASVNNAIGAMPGKEIMIAESPGEYVSAILKLLSDASLYSQVSSNSKKFVEVNFDWKQNGLKICAIFAENNNIHVS
ncbi:MAG: glycosyltransferase [Saprospiraceae bacterium]|nr:glycosyltransferase [Saprospiraceae bacterium]